MCVTCNITKMLKELEMFKHHIILTTKSAMWEKPVIVIFLLCLVFAFSSLYGTGTDTVSNSFDAKDVPKSYDYILYPNSGPTFTTVLTLIQNRYNNNEKNIFKVALANGNYAQSVCFLFNDSSTAFNEIYVEFVGLGISTQIMGDNLLISDVGNLHFKFSNLSITGGARGIEALITPNTGALTFLEVQNCKIFGNIGTNYGLEVNMDGAGIYAEGPATITGCEIYNNTGKNYWISNNGVENFSRGGGIAVINNSTYETIIDNNVIHDNVAIAGGGIYATGTGQITISNNIVDHNTRSIYLLNIGGQIWQCQGGAGEGIWVNECDRLTLAGNIIKNQIPGTLGDRDDMPVSSATVVEYCGYSPSITSVVIENNSFMDNGNCHGLWLRSPLGGTRIRNNLSCNNKFGFYCSDYTNGLITMTYNDAYQNGTLNNEVQNYYLTQENWIVQSNNGEYDPMVDSEYAPLWNASVISPLIDSGYPGICDPDSTASDIGAIRAGDHQHDNYDMPNGYVSNGIKWMSFPTINSITSGYNVSQNFFGPIVDPDILEWVQWKEPGVQLETMYFIGTELQNGNQEVSSVQGYKVKVQWDVFDDYAIAVSGYRQAPYTVIPLVGGNEENWIGYFCEDSSSVLDAFAPILTNINSITTQYWSATQIFPGVWLGNVGERVLNQGDMVIVKCVQNCSFSWNNNQPVPPKSKDLPKEFTFTEKPDYTPVYISVDQSKNPELPAEIGLYVNGVCKGAVVVDNPEIDICAYLDANEAITEENSQLVFYYPAKSAADKRSIYSIKGKSLKHNTKGTEYYALDIDDMESAVSVSSTPLLSQNYPNPFNPTTTISFEIPNDAHVNLDIYNVRGQMVKRLVNTQKAIGKHSVVWDGKDEQGRDCSSGIYYYRLKSHGLSHSQKMLLLK